MANESKDLEYFVQKFSAGTPPEIEIDEKRFHELKQSMDCLFASLAIETKYEFIIANYLELEKEGLNKAIGFMTRYDINHE